MTGRVVLLLREQRTGSRQTSVHPRTGVNREPAAAGERRAKGVPVLLTPAPFLLYSAHGVKLVPDGYGETPRRKMRLVSPIGFDIVGMPLMFLQTAARASARVTCRPQTIAGCRYPSP